MWELVRYINYGETEIKYLNESIKNASVKINLLRLNVREKFEEKYVNFKPIKLEHEVLLQNSSDLVEDVKQLQSRLDTQTKQDIGELTEELKGLRESLIESSTIVEMLCKLCRIERELSEAKEQTKMKNYYLTAKYFNNISRLVNEECKDLEFLDIYRHLTESIIFYKDKCCRESLEQWKKNIVWTRIESDLKNNKSVTTLSVSSEKAFLESLFKTLEMYDISDRELAAFSDNLLKMLLIPVIHKTAVITAKKNQKSTEELSVQCISDSKYPPYKDVLKNLTAIFQFIDQVLGISLHDTRFISRLGLYISEDFLSILVNECLTDAVLLQIGSLTSSSNAPAIVPITDFQSYLITIGFLPVENSFLETHFGNIEALALNKTIERYNDTARSLMKKDLLEVVELEDSSFQSKLEVRKQEPSASEAPIDVDKICPNLFVFPKCSISKSVQDLVDLIHKILNEANESNEKSCIELFHLARGIIEIYPGLVSMHHAKFLHDIPQCSALLFNNLLYLAHHMQTIDYDKKSRATSTKGNYPPISCFSDLIIPLRKEATQVLSAQVENQKKILLVMIKESGLSALSEYEELPECTEKSVRACLRQLTHLQAVWQKVLAQRNYADVIGGLCTVLVDEITNRIVSTSDIRADIATSLVKVLSLIQTGAPRLFTDPNDVYIHVKSWSKLKELILILGASLAEVGERWADGKGPLAMEFNVKQVRQMIKALFQVSDRRAVVLSRIKK